MIHLGVSEYIADIQLIHGGAKIRILFSSGKNNIFRTSARHFYRIFAQLEQPGKSVRREMTSSIWIIGGYLPYIYHYPLS